VIKIEKLKCLRQSSNYTIQSMANNLSISKAFYWQIENKKRNLSYDMAVKIATIFNMKPDEIFYDEFEKKGE
jgi:putative transcriptional regulator